MLEVESKIILPEAPAEIAGQPVLAWQQDVTIDTYEVDPPDSFPAYLDSRVYQGSSGRVYPLPFYERVQTVKHPRSWHALHLENGYVRLMVLPELGGRIHFGLDKTRGYDFFYRNNVIKPALVGVTGPWISGGVEFNWPQHHRPATYLPVSWQIEEEADGSRTVWCADLDPFARMLGMHGVRLRPDSSVVELRVRLFNRTDDVQTFLWWANVAAPVGPDYQSFFPPDVHHVADHAKRAVTSFPKVRGLYYGVDYQARVTPSHPDADRLDWYGNIPVPTSYMCLGSEGDFFGGYDHGRRAGFVHWADHRISPGKKQWTWGNAPFGWAWDANLTDGDGPYVELMAGVYTDNQPDFSFLAPGETKEFSQCWYPIQDIGPAQQATLDGAVRLTVDDGVATVGFAATRAVAATVTLLDGDTVLWRAEADCAPGSPILATVGVPRAAAGRALTVLVEADGSEVVRWTTGAGDDDGRLPDPAVEPPAPADIDTVEELYLTGLHLEQYRHATRSPVPYWQEALRRDPGDSRVNIALAARDYRDGLLASAEARLELAVSRLVRRNPNPYDGEAHFRLGVVKQALGKLDDADRCFAKASWNQAWKAPSELALARLAARRGDWRGALHRASAVAALDANQRQAAAIVVLALRRLGDAERAEQALAEFRTRFGIDWWLTDLAGEAPDTDAATLIDVALEYQSLGLHSDALRVLRAAAEREATDPVEGQGRQLPLVLLHQAHLHLLAGDGAAAAELIAAAGQADRTTCFPGRLADALMLARLREFAPGEPVLGALLGHWLYSRGRVEDAVAAWRDAPDDPVAVRNLGVAAYNHGHDPVAAVEHYERALLMAPEAGRLAYERDQLAKRLGESLEQRLARLAPRQDAVAARDDLSVEYARLLTGVGRAREALALLGNRQFQPWEGGEGQVLGAWEDACLAAAFETTDAAEAVALARAALVPPANLGEARHPLANTARLELALGDALEAQGDHDEAVAAWRRASTAQGDFVAMATTPYSERSMFSALAFRRLGQDAEAVALATAMRDWAERTRGEPAGIDYFATSLPSLLLFNEDLTRRHELTCDLLVAQASYVLGEYATARDLVGSVQAADPADPSASQLSALLAAVPPEVNQPLSSTQRR